MTQIRDHLIKSVRDLLDDGFEIEDLTVRQIAYEAHVATGLLNYHFGSKQKLIVEAISSIIEDATADIFRELSKESDTPQEQLKKFLKTITLVVYKYNKYSKILIQDELLSNRFSTPETLLPFLKALKPKMPEHALRVLAIQIVAPLQYVFLKEDGFQDYLTTDHSSESFKADMYDSLIDRVLETLGI